MDYFFKSMHFIFDDDDDFKKEALWTSGVQDDQFLPEAICKYFDNQLFVSQESYNASGNEEKIKLVFNPCRKRMYFLKESKVDRFIKKYYPTKQIIVRKPDYFVFAVPFPNILFSKEPYYGNENKSFVIDINKYFDTTYKPIDSYKLGIGRNTFKPLFVKTFNEAYELKEDYTDFFSQFYSVDKSQINCSKLIKPFYKLSFEESTIILDIRDDIEGEMWDAHAQHHEAQEEKLRDEQYSDYMDSVHDEWNSEAFDNDIENNWNID